MSASTIDSAVSSPMSTLILKLDVNSTRKPVARMIVLMMMATPTFSNA